MKNMTVDEFKQILDAHGPKAIIDVRTPMECIRGKIAGSINIPVDSIHEKAEQLIPDKHVPIYVYCLSGSRSALAASTLERLGYTNVTNVLNGLLAWRAKSYPLV